MKQGPIETCLTFISKTKLHTYIIDVHLLYDDSKYLNICWIQILFISLNIFILQNMLKST